MAERPKKRNLTRANRALDATNFFLADVRDGLGPYLAIYLLTEQKWDEASIGVVMSIATVAGILAQTPAGALVDATRAKRAVMVVAAIVVTAVLDASAVAAGILAGRGHRRRSAHAAERGVRPALAAVTLGIFGHQAFTKRIGRNETFNHAGNACAASCGRRRRLCLGPIGRLLSACGDVGREPRQRARDPGARIDHDLARGLHDAEPGQGEQTDKRSRLPDSPSCSPAVPS